MIDVFTKVVLAGACLFTFAWVIFAQRRTIKRLSDAYLRLTHFQRVLAALAVIVCTVYAQKPSTNDVEGVTGTNQVEIVEGGDTNQVGGIVLNAPQPMSNGASFFGGCGPLGATGPTVAVRPYRLESVSTSSDISYAMPSDGTICGTWHLTGAYEDVQKVALDGFVFPLGADLCTSLWAYTWGKVRPQLKNASNEIAAIGAPMSAIPEVSRFWIAATSNDTYLLTWENFAAGRLPAPRSEGAPPVAGPPGAFGGGYAGTVNAQIELFRNGDFITRSNGVESVWRRRLPCDLDEDGWIDVIDPNPTEFNEDGFGPHQTLPVGDNTNYYYWVDLVVDQANARVTFEGEGHSALPDPDFIARAGETNRVMLLIGKSYVVNCDFPIRCVDKEDDEVCVWGEGRSLGILWPIYLDFVPTEPLLLLAGPLLGAPSNGGGDAGVSIHPERAGGGDFSWPDNFCCYTTAADGSPIFCCDGNCGCGGCSTGDITYRIGEHELAYGGWSCGCSHEPDDPHDADPPDDPPSGPSVSATFSHDAIIFEDEYENSPGVFVPRRSTEVEAEFYVYGGTNGGSYAFTLADGGRLQRLGGSYVPRNGTVNAGEGFHIKVRYDAVSASGSEGDIKAKVEFTENGSGRKISNEAELTAVKVEVVAEANFPTNRNRHRFGPGEEVKIFYTPGVSGLHTIARNGLIMEESLGFVKYECPHTVRTSGVGVSLASVEFDIGFSVVAPIGYQIYQIATNSWANIGQSGGFVMEFYGYVLPRDVSFEKLQIMEVPMISTDPYGYYAQDSKTNLWNHGNHGAGEWSDVMSENRMYDMAVMEINEKPWLDGGYFTWPVPDVWRVAADHDVQNEFCNTDQRFELFSNGKSELTKFGFCGSRMTNNVFTITRSGN